MYVRTFECIFVFMYVCLNERIYVFCTIEFCVYVFMYECMYEYMYLPLHVSMYENT